MGSTYQKRWLLGKTDFSPTIGGCTRRAAHRSVGADVSRRRKQKALRFVVSPIELVLTYKMFVFWVLRISSVITCKVWRLRLLRVGCNGAVGGEKSVFTRNTNLIRTPKIPVFFYWAYFVSVALVAWKNGFFPYYMWLHAESCAPECRSRRLQASEAEST